MQQQNKSAGDNDWMHELGVGRGEGGGDRDYPRLLSAVARVLGDVRSTYRGGGVTRWRHVYRGAIKSFLCDGR